MAFVRVEKLRIGGAGPQPPQITMGAYLADGKTHKARSISFRISKSLIEQLGWKDEDRVMYLIINEGTDVDRGLMQIIPSSVDAPSSRRTMMGTGRDQGLSVSVAAAGFKHYVLNECPVPSRPVQHMIDGNALIVECPDWLRFNPQSAPEPKPAPVTELHTRRGPGRPRRQQG